MCVFAFHFYNDLEFSYAHRARFTAIENLWFVNIMGIHDWPSSKCDKAHQAKIQCLDAPNHNWKIFKINFSTHQDEAWEWNKKLKQKSSKSEVKAYLFKLLSKFSVIFRPIVTNMLSVYFISMTIGVSTEIRAVIWIWTNTPTEMGRFLIKSQSLA